MPRPSNPLTHELNAVLSLAALRELPHDAAPERREQLLREMEVRAGWGGAGWGGAGRGGAGQGEM